MLGAVVPDVGGVYTGVTDGDQAPAPHLALRHVQQEAELAVLAPGIAAAPSGAGGNNQLYLLQPYILATLNNCICKRKS